MLCNTKSDSVYKILSEKKITEVKISSYQFTKDGRTVMEMNSRKEIDYFKSWFKPSMKTHIDDSSIALFKPSGLIVISIEGEKPLEISYQLFNCYVLRYKEKKIYEQFSYQFGQTLLELFEKEAQMAGKKFNE